MPHANMQYSQLPPEKRLWVIENCYKKLFTLVKENDYKIAFEASGKTVEEIAEKSPETMKKVKRIIVMGGAFFNGKLEWNIMSDALAAKKVFESGIPVYAVGTDVTAKLKLNNKRQF